MPDLFQQSDLPYQPLPSAAYTAARMSILKCKFSEQALLDEYSFSSGIKGRTIKVNTFVFAHPTHRNPAEYASVTVYNAVNGLPDDEIVKILAESAAPFHLIHRENRFSFWASSLNRANQAEAIPVRTNIDYDQLDGVLSEYADDFQPQRIKVSRWDEEPQISLDPQPDRASANWIISGVVDSINAEQGTITLWMEGFRELQTVRIVSMMPGWMLRPNAAFRTKIPRKFVKQGSIDMDTADWGQFQPQLYTYMDEEELLEELGKLLQADDKNRI